MLIVDGLCPVKYACLCGILRPTATAGLVVPLWWQLRCDARLQQLQLACAGSRACQAVYCRHVMGVVCFVGTHPLWCAVVHMGQCHTADCNLLMTFALNFRIMSVHHHLQHFLPGARILPCMAALH
jgi:hypothetical protein